MNLFTTLSVFMKKAVAVLISIGISLGLLSSFAADTDLSFKSLVARESIRTLMHTIDPKGGGTLFKSLAGKITTTPSVYVPSREYTYTKQELENCTLEIITKKDGENNSKVIYQIHGGAFIFGMQDLYRWQAETWSENCGGATVVMIDYRLAPETVFPGALDDVIDGWEWITSHGYDAEDIVVTGDSAGGNLTLGLILSLRNFGKALPAAAVTMSPWCDLAAEGETYTTNIYKDPMFGIKEGNEVEIEVTDLARLYAADTDLHDPLLSPLYSEFDGFCPTLIQVGTSEVLYSDSVTVSEKMERADVDVTLTQYTGMWHVFQLFGNKLPEGEDAWNEAFDFANRFLYN